jgi:predicted MPP superfamily phosphohydrolase
MTVAAQNGRTAGATTSSHDSGFFTRLIVEPSGTDKIKTVLAFFFSALFSARVLPDFIGLSLVALLQSAGVFVILMGPAARARKPVRYSILAAWAVSMVVLALGFMLRFARVARHFPEWFAGWGRGLAMLWAFFSVLMLAAYAISRAVPAPRPEHSPARRTILRAVRTAILAGPVAAVGYGTFVARFSLSLREVNAQIPGLAKDLDGLRIVQLTDIHLSPFLSLRQLERAVEMANETRAHVALVTGDLISSASDPLDDCLNALSRLRADAGVLGCMGNHEIYADSEAYTQTQGARLGMRFLRQQAAVLRFGAADINFAGVDYQRFHKPYLVGAERLAVPGALNVLLSHNPDVFPVAVRKGFPFTIAGHTHGGQVRFEILNQDLNVARFFTPYVDGVYRLGGSSIFVSRGIGTIGVPTRLGAPPEVALIRLCRT